MNEYEDVKRLLSRAFGPEPPLRLDRDGLFRRGRRRVRARWMAASGGVAAAVVAVAVGIALLPSLGKPVTNPAHGSGTARPAPSTVYPTTAVRPPVLPGRVPVTSGDRAAQLTKAFVTAEVLPGLEIVPVSPDALAVLEFRPDGVAYNLVTDLRDKAGVGSLHVQVMYLPNEPLPRCEVVEPEQQSCVTDQEPGVRMWIKTVRAANGIMAYRVSAVRDDGTRLFVTTSNGRFRGYGDGELPVLRPVPPVSVGALTSIAALSGLSYF